MPRILVYALFLLTSLGGIGLASTSLVLGTILPGWERLREEPVVSEARRILRSYALQIPEVLCLSHEVHYRSSGRLFARSLYVDTWLESSGRLVPILEDRRQHILLFYPRFSSPRLVVVFQLDEGLLLATC
jgi:hypothetical protein